MKIANKELLNKHRVLTLSPENNKIDYLVVNCEHNSAILIGINNSGHTDDIVFIKEIFYNKFTEAIEKVKCICYEFDITRVLVAGYGISKGFYDEFVLKANPSDIKIKGIALVNYNYVLSKMKADIENSKLRFVQDYSLAKMSYDKTFLGYSQVMDIHRETDKLINEFDSVTVTEIEDGYLRLNCIKKERNRFESLSIYYSYKYNYCNKEMNE